MIYSQSVGLLKMSFEKSIIKLQSAIRGYLARRMVHQVLSSFRMENQSIITAVQAHHQNYSSQVTKFGEIVDYWNQTLLFVDSSKHFEAKLQAAIHDHSIRDCMASVSLQAVPAGRDQQPDGAALKTNISILELEEEAKKLQEAIVHRIQVKCTFVFLLLL